MEKKPKQIGVMSIIPLAAVAGAINGALNSPVRPVDTAGVAKTAALDTVDDPQAQQSYEDGKTIGHL